MIKPGENLSRENREKILNVISEFLRGQNDILFAYVYGSFVEERPFRDIDIALYFTSDFDFNKVFELEEEIQDKIEFFVDVQPLNEAPLAFTFRVVSTGKLLFSKDEKVRCSFEERTRVLYFDFKPYLERYFREVVLHEYR